MAHVRVDLEEHVEKMFFEEYTAHQVEEVWKLYQAKAEPWWMMGLEDTEHSSTSNQRWKSLL